MNTPTSFLDPALPPWYSQTAEGQRLQQEREEHRRRQRQSAANDIEQMQIVTSKEAAGLNKLISAAVAKRDRARTAYSDAERVLAQLRREASALSFRLDRNVAEREAFLRSTADSRIEEAIEMLRAEEDRLRKLQPAPVAIARRWTISGRQVDEAMTNEQDIKARLTWIREVAVPALDGLKLAATPDAQRAITAVLGDMPLIREDDGR